MRAKTFWASSSLAAALLLVGGQVAAKTFNLEGLVTTCTPTCNSFAFLGPDTTGGDAQSELTGFLTMDDAAIADGTWVGADVTGLSFTVFDPIKPIIHTVPPNPVTDNPFVIDQTADGGGIVVAAGQPITNPRDSDGNPANGVTPWPVCVPPATFGCVQSSAGTTDGSVLNGGFIDLWLTVGTLAANGAVIHIDFSTGTFTVNIFENLIFVAGGTVAPAVQDTDGDGLADNADNCTADANNGQAGTGPAQNDTDGDGIGNVCDADFDQLCSVNFGDLGIMKGDFFIAPGPEGTDMNGDGFVNFSDLGFLKAGFFLPPGPSGVPNVCSP